MLAAATAAEAASHQAEELAWQAEWLAREAEELVPVAAGPQRQPWASQEAGSTTVGAASRLLAVLACSFACTSPRQQWNRATQRPHRPRRR